MISQLGKNAACQNGEHSGKEEISLNYVESSHNRSQWGVTSDGFQSIGTEYTKLIHFLTRRRIITLLGTI